MGPPDDDLVAAWRRLAADPATGAAFAGLAIPVTARALAARRPLADPVDIETAAADAVLAVLKHPARYDPTKAPLPAFLLLVARRRLSNLREAEGRHHSGRIPWDAVELTAAGRNDEGEDDAPSLADPRVWAAVDRMPAADRRVFELMQTEWRTAPFAALLGLLDRPDADQRAEVKRAKDRVIARLKRAVGGSHD